ncbi:Hypothetical protein LOCK900_2875 [Lacticaseibacillus rhamnosus LOCK900]|nr:Hypothetical protein LOCK900_2875 [Lacticaseibacillus rhamnosus LOCK900]
MRTFLRKIVQFGILTPLTDFSMAYCRLALGHGDMQKDGRGRLLKIVRIKREWTDCC